MGAMSATAFSLTRCRAALSVGMQVEAQDGDVDDGDVEVTEGRGGGAGDAFESYAHDVPGVLGGERHDESDATGGEVSQVRRC